MGTRTITGTLKRFDNTGWANAEIKIALQTDWATAAAVAFPKLNQTFTTDINGAIPAGVTLVTPPTGAWSYLCTIENNTPFTVLLEDGGDLTIDEFIALAGLGGSEAGTPQFEWLASVFSGLAGANAGDFLIADGEGDAAWAADLRAVAVQVNLDTHIADTTNPHEVTKAQVGLGNVPNLDTTTAVNNAAAETVTGAALRTAITPAAARSVLNIDGAYHIDVREWGMVPDDDSFNNRQFFLDGWTNVVRPLAESGLPAIIDLSAGVYGMFGGVAVTLPAGQGNITIYGGGTGGLKMTKLAGLSTNEFFMFKIQPDDDSFDPTDDTERDDPDNYIHDIRFVGLRFFDPDPITHATSEESHGLGLNRCRNSAVIDFYGEGWGDEGVELVHCWGVQLDHLRFLDIGLANQADGGALSVSVGCRDIQVGSIYCKNARSEGSGYPSAVHIRTPQQPVAVDGVQISQIIANNCVNALSMSASAAEIKNVSVGNILAINTDYGVDNFSSGTKNITIDSVIIRNCIRGIWARNVPENWHFGYIFVDTSSNIGISIVAPDNIKIDYAHIRNTQKEAIRVEPNFGTGVIIDGGVCDNVGIDMSGNLGVIVGPGRTRKSHLKNMQLINSGNTVRGIEGWTTVDGCVVENTGSTVESIRTSQAVIKSTVTNGRIQAVTNGIVRDCTVTNATGDTQGCIQLLTTTNVSIIGGLYTNPSQPFARVATGGGNHRIGWVDASGCGSMVANIDGGTYVDTDSCILP